MTKCTTAEFGDVAPGQVKSCWCDDAKKEAYKLEKEMIAEKCADEGG